MTCKGPRVTLCCWARSPSRRTRARRTAQNSSDGASDSVCPTQCIWRRWPRSCSSSSTDCIGRWDSRPGPPWSPPSTVKPRSRCASTWSSSKPLRASQLKRKDSYYSPHFFCPCVCWSSDIMLPIIKMTCNVSKKWNWNDVCVDSIPNLWFCMKLHKLFH